ncbi:16S rRNA (adenine(1518)-N(6)/adenine(1519)-N(6))-dimethyltransferase RsmA [Hyperthermus butylicus]|uniref:Dimethyladenosine transferase n=1 Tax=Hyperthermus butylicus (strain DSM 5456 / JCM 9403 / PLM1-5) TaxID=415426 RepID=A2BNB0_HYPBU|nr:16S rRNA (adenine(1518)-N(6)/adenine(1519)-N(6))-dimethyltransferase RsmA [Hyperthermus butylicus]ABM81471.1 Dimethyladenosine transferase [Hyperthermus butylicus DSM 5456]
MLRARRELGQHFLVARWVARIFAGWACRFRRLLEVGVGQGFLTSTILRSCSVEIAGLELDLRLVGELASISFYFTGFMPVIADAVEPPLRLGGVDAVYGSIPYNITGPLLSLLVVEARKPALLLLQREVVDRLAAKPGTASYGRITVLVRLVYDVKPGPVVPPSAFRPRPKVYSRIVELVPRPDAPSPDMLRRVEELTKCMFSERNKRAAKVAAKCIGIELSKIEGLVGRDIRVYQLEPEKFIQLLDSQNG